MDPVELQRLPRFKGLLTIKAIIGEGKREILVVAKGRNGARGEGKVIVEVTPSLRLAASPEVVVVGATTGIGVRIARGGFSGPVKLRCEGDLAGTRSAPLKSPRTRRPENSRSRFSRTPCSELVS